VLSLLNAVKEIKSDNETKKLFLTTNFDSLSFKLTTFKNKKHFPLKEVLSE